VCPCKIAALRRALAPHVVRPQWTRQTAIAMCGRFIQDLTADEAADYFAAEPTALVHEAQAKRRYNVGPGQEVLAVRLHPKTHVRTLDALHWGLVPHFASDRKGAYRLINARAETIDQRGTFRGAFERRRCLVVARGFYEWRKEGKHKQPFAIVPRDGEPTAFAGIWENWLDPQTGEWLRSVAIVTTAANEDVRALHDRMPVVIAPAHFASWLGEQPVSPDELKALLSTGRDTPAYETYPVHPRMNRATVDDPDVVAPFEPAQNPREDG
jgi:putative SOS response-associated peptidase YedK